MAVRRAQKEHSHKDQTKPIKKRHPRRFGGQSLLLAADTQQSPIDLHSVIESSRRPPAICRLGYLERFTPIARRLKLHTFFYSSFQNAECRPQG
jgi:hypothetical protein